MAEHLIEITDENWNEAVASAPRVVVDFWAEWCAPCKRLMPVVEEVAGEMGGTVKFVKVNVDTCQEIATQFQVMSIPTIIFVENGEEKERMVGAANKAQLTAKIKAAFGIA